MIPNAQLASGQECSKVRWRVRGKGDVFHRASPRMVILFEYVRQVPCCNAGHYLFLTCFCNIASFFSAEVPPRPWIQTLAGHASQYPLCSAPALPYRACIATCGAAKHSP